MRSHVVVFEERINSIRVKTTTRDELGYFLTFSLWEREAKTKKVEAQ
jgi:hypothetical protein